MVIHHMYYLNCLLKYTLFKLDFSIINNFHHLYHCKNLNMLNMLIHYNQWQKFYLVKYDNNLFYIFILDKLLWSKLLN